MDQEHIHQLLREPSFYPEHPSTVVVRETHISRVYLLESHVYKMKKDLALGFLDFSSLEKRRHYCEEELRLNRRFCPDTYLEVVDVCHDNGNLHIGPPGEPVECLLRMRRLPEERMLQVLLREGAPGLSDAMVALGRRLAFLHGETPPCNHDQGYSDLMHIRRNWEENFRQTKLFAGVTISPGGFSALESYVGQFLQDNAEMLTQREQDGCVRECHGDLHAEHVCMTDPIRIFDCIEFNRRFRVSDILSDTAFLLMDLDRYNRRDLAERLWQVYSEVLAGPVSEKLIGFYKVYRAFVRGKVSSILTAEKDVEAGLRAHAHHDALGYFNLALGYLLPQMLLITCGLMGTGKSTLAKTLETALPVSVIRSDIIRLQFKESPDAGMRADYLQGPYRPEVTEMVYRQLEEQALPHLQAGRSVLLDASFGNAAQRRRMKELAAESGVPFAILLCECPRDVTLTRLDGRTERHEDVSDGRAELYDLQAARFETPGHGEPVIQVSTCNPAEYAANAALGVLARNFGRGGSSQALTIRG